MNNYLLPHKANWLILTLYLVLATIYSVMTPAWEAPDEVGHFAVIQHIRQSGSLPDARKVAAGEAHQPPLYYLIAAAATLPVDLSSSVGAFRVNPDFMWNRNGGTDVNANLRDNADSFPFIGQVRGLHLVRLVSVLMGAATVVLVMGIGHHIFPSRPEVGWLAGGLVALNPQFLFLSGAVNNDNLLILLVTGTIWQTLRAMKRPFAWQQWAMVGLWLSAVLLTKLSGAAILLAVGLVLIRLSVQKRSFRILLRGGLSIGSVLLILCGWWFVRNQLLYGDLLGYTVFQDIFAVNIRQTPLQWSDLATFSSVQFRSFWGVFGWMNLPAPTWFFTAVRLLLSSATIGLFVTLTRQLNVSWKKKNGTQISQINRDKSKKSAFIRVNLRPIKEKTNHLNSLLDADQKQSLGFLAAAIILQEIFIMWMLTRCNIVCYQGRFLLPVSAPIMIFISLGLLALVPNQQHVLVIIVVSILTAVALFMPLQIIRPAYQMGSIP
jgi:4-amino-4-deoxy-L-arabinose transferase-like glycosyltransferase